MDERRLGITSFVAALLLAALVVYDLVVIALGDMSLVTVHLMFGTPLTPPDAALFLFYPVLWGVGGAALAALGAVWNLRAHAAGAREGAALGALALWLCLFFVGSTGYLMYAIPRMEWG